MDFLDFVIFVCFSGVAIGLLFFVLAGIIYLIDLIHTSVSK